MRPNQGDDSQRDRPAGPGEPRPAGPVAGQGPQAHPPGDPDPAPPAGGESPGDAAGSASQGSPGGGGSGAGAQDQALGAVEQDLDALLSERDEYLELAKRTKADFENYRRRMAGEVQAAAERGKVEIARQMIDAVDNLERALGAAGVDPDGGEGGTDVQSPDELAQGVLMVFRGLRETLGRNGIEPVDPRGERFDPNLHEALSTLPAEGAESGTVIETMQKGYRLGEQLIRPARVVVAQ